MPEESFTPKQIQEIVKKACEISDFEKRELYIKQACYENKACNEEVNYELQKLVDKSNLHTKTTENLDDSNEIIFTDAVIEILKGKEPELLGKKIGGYTLTKQLGKGGFAHVYRGAKQDEGDFEDFAVKVIVNPDFSKEYFFEETEKLKKVNQHPNIARLHESGIDKETNYPYFALQYINGKPLTDYCEDKTLSLTKRLSLFLTVCEAVSYSHSKAQLIHCDIKPSNILVRNEDENPFLIDFGIAKIISRNSKTTNPIGFSFESSSPELVSGKEPTKATDIYSLGTVLYELLTGHKAHTFLENASWESMKTTVCEQPPEIPSQVIHKNNIKEISENRKCTPEELERFLKGKLDEIILKCLKKDTKNRYETVRDLIEAINIFLKQWKENLQQSLVDKNSLKIIPSRIFKPSIIFSLSIGISTLLVHILLYYLVKSNENDPIIPSGHPERHLYQAGVCLIFYLILLFVPTSKTLKNEVFKSVIARNSFHQFLNGLQAIWITWFWLYLYFYVMSGFDNSNVNNAVAQTTIDFLNACTSIAFLYLFLVMNMPSVSTENNSDRNQNFQRNLILVIIFGILIVIYAGLGRFTKDDYSTFVSGFFAAISMCYFFGRLDSLFMNTGRWELILLYAYASIQIIGPKLVDLGKNTQTPEIIKRNDEAFFIILLGFKIYLFVFVFLRHLLDGTFVEYFNRASNYFESKQSDNRLD